MSLRVLTRLSQQDWFSEPFLSTRYLSVLYVRGNGNFFFDFFLSAAWPRT